MAHEELENARAAIRRAIEVTTQDKHRDIREVLESIDESLAGLDETDDERLREDRIVEVKRELRSLQNNVSGELGSRIDAARESLIAYEKARL